MVAALATIIDGALVLLLTSVGLIAASVIRGRGTQITRSWLSITAFVAVHIGCVGGRQIPVPERT